LTVSPDGRRLVYTQNSRGGIDLSLIQFQNDTRHEATSSWLSLFR
jgi:Tol biopolymer transport system component